MSGCTGKMGRVITAAVKEKADCKNDSKGAGTGISGTASVSV